MSDYQVTNFGMCGECKRHKGVIKRTHDSDYYYYVARCSWHECRTMTPSAINAKRYGKEQTMIKYMTDVIRYMRKFPLSADGRFIVWLRNCLYLNWQKPWKWNLDIYWLWKQVERSRWRKKC